MIRRIEPPDPGDGEPDSDGVMDRFRDDGDVVRVMRRSVVSTADGDMCNAVTDAMTAEIRHYADRYGFDVVGNPQGSARFTDGHIVLEVQALLRPSTDGVWGEIRLAIAQDEVDRRVLHLVETAGPDYEVLDPETGALYWYDGSDWVTD